MTTLEIIKKLEDLDVSVQISNKWRNRFDIYWMIVVQTKDRLIFGRGKNFEESIQDLYEKWDYT